jgi:hypothetical protein
MGHRHFDRTALTVRLKFFMFTATATTTATMVFFT